MRKFKVGDIVWFRDENRRRYREGQSGPIEEHHWVSYEVLGIEKRSYRMSWPTWDPLIGFAKAERIYLTEAEKVDDIWVRVHRYPIIDLLKRVDPATVRRVAELLGYKGTAC